MPLSLVIMAGLIFDLIVDLMVDLMNGRFNGEGGLVMRTAGQ